MSDDAPQKKPDEGAPAWVMTFADLMSLLMCFFVLLLSFSEMDVAKYKQLAGSLKFAFGVQREIKAKEPPKGINVIAREFSPGRPEPTPFNVIRQMTTMENNINLDLGKERRKPVPTSDPDSNRGVESGDKKHDKGGGTGTQEAGSSAAQKQASKEAKQKGSGAQEAGLSEAQKKALRQAKQKAAERLDKKLKTGGVGAGGAASGKLANEKALAQKIKAKEAAERQKKLKESARLISNALGREIKSGSVDVEIEDKKIIIRVREKASFRSGSADLKTAFRPLLGKVAKILKGSEGKIVVAGHTDNLPIFTERFRSNWELSSARAVSVVHQMVKAGKVPANRFLIEGYGDTRPLVSNKTAKNRAKNRRVEIILQQGQDKEAPEKTIASVAAKKSPAGNVKKNVKAKVNSKKSVKPVSKAVTSKSVKAKAVAKKPSASQAVKAKSVKQPAKAAKKVNGIKAAGSR